VTRTRIEEVERHRRYRAALAFSVTAALVAAAAAAGPAHAAGGPAPGAASASTVKLPDGPGSVAGLGGEAEVGVFSAQVGYGVPFELPAAPGGFGPSVSLSYAGELGNGPVGVGWSLSVAAIRRSTRDGVPSFTTRTKSRSRASAAAA
jgi:hypothetical protein